MEIALTSIIAYLLAILPLCVADYDYVLGIHKYKNFEGPHVNWYGKFGECGKQRATYTTLANDILASNDAYAAGIRFDGFHVDSVTLPIGGVGCTIFTKYVPPPAPLYVTVEIHSADPFTHS